MVIKLPKEPHLERVTSSTESHASVRVTRIVSMDTTVSEPCFREDRVPTLDPVVKSIRRRVVCTGVWHVGGFGVCGRVFAFLAALVGRQTNLSHVSKGVCDVLDKDTCGRRRTRVFGFDAKFNGMRTDEVYPSNATPVIRRVSGQNWYSPHRQIDPRCVPMVNGGWRVTRK